MDIQGHEFAHRDVEAAVAHAKATGWRTIARRVGVKLAQRDARIARAIEADKGGWTYAASHHQEVADANERGAVLLDYAARMAHGKAS